MIVAGGYDSSAEPGSYPGDSPDNPQGPVQVVEVPAERYNQDAKDLYDAQNGPTTLMNTITEIIIDLFGHPTGGQITP